VNREVEERHKESRLCFPSDMMLRLPCQGLEAKKGYFESGLKCINNFACGYPTSPPSFRDSHLRPHSHLYR
jgi:hypothetical protein